MLLTEETAQVCFHVYGCWFGPPPAVFEKSTLIDGRLRSSVAPALGVRVPKARVLKTIDQVVRWLLAAGHHERARQWCDEYSIPVDDILMARLGLPAFAVAPLLVKPKSKRGRPRENGGRHRRRFANHREAAESLISMIEQAQENNEMVDPGVARTFLKEKSY